MTQVFAKDPRLKTVLKLLFGTALVVAAIAVFWPSPPPHETKTSVVVTNSPEPIAAPLIQDSSTGSPSIVVSPDPKKRSITPEQAAKMKIILAPFAGSKITLVSKKTDNESRDFRDQLGKVIGEAGWLIKYVAANSIGHQPSLWLRVSTADAIEGPYMDNAPATRLRRNAAAVMKAVKEGLGMDCQLRADPQLSAGQMELRAGSIE